MNTRRELAKRMSTTLFLGAERIGVHVAPAHYYSSTPDRRWLRQHPELWRRPSSMVGIDWDVDAQLGWLQEAVGDHVGETPLEGIFSRAEAVGGFRYGPIEAQVLHGWVRTHAPGRVFEIGSGSTTQITSRAVEMNVAEGRRATEIIAVDPYVDDAVADLPHVTVRKVGGLELTPDDIDLEPGDLLFIDSTHTVRAGSEVPHIYLELLPRVAAGVTVHIHDIYLPYLFAPSVLQSQFDWQETTLVAALLQGSTRLSVGAALSALHHDRPEDLAALFPEYRPAPMADGIVEGEGHFPSSLWLEVRDQPTGGV